MSRIYEAVNGSDVYPGNGANAAVDRPRVACAGSPNCGLSPELLNAIEEVRYQPGPGRSVVPNSNGGRFARERFRYLAHRLRQLRSSGRAVSRVLVTSAVPSEGKTFIAVNLAAALARNSHRVLLVDADIRNRGAGDQLGMPNRPGLADVLTESSELATVLCRIVPLGFFCLPSGAPERCDPGDLLQSARMRLVLDALAATFEWIVVDSPPLGLFVDAHCLAALTDTVLLAVRLGVTPKTAFREAVAGFTAEFISGVVINGGEENPREYYYRSVEARS